jgi:lysozyme
MEARPLPYRLQALLDVGGSLSVEDCSELLDIDIAIVLVDMNRFNWFEGLSYARKTALCDMVYNLGLSRFMGFKKLIAALSEGDYDTAATEMLRSKWAVDVGHNRSTTLSEIVRTDEL